MWRCEISEEEADEGEGGVVTYWTWTIFDGPVDPDDVVLWGATEYDPTELVSDIVNRHNVVYRPLGTPSGGHTWDIA